MALKVAAKGAPRKARTQYRSAAQFYSEALAARHPSDAANATYYANRAQAHLLLGNSGKALADSLSALRLAPGHIKARFRAAKAAMDLGKLEAALEHARAGLEADPSSAEMGKLAEGLQAKLKSREERAARVAAMQAKARALADAIAARGIVVGGQKGRCACGGARSLARGASQHTLSYRS